MKLILFLIYFSGSSFIGFAQKQNHAPKIFTSSTYSFYYEKGYGVWKLNMDSSFLFLAIDSEKVRCAGMGKWLKGKGGDFEFTFHDIRTKIPMKNVLEYKALNKGSQDSVYVTGSLKYDDGTTLLNLVPPVRNIAHGGFILFDNKKYAPVDTFGNFYQTFPKDQVTLISGYNLTGEPVFFPDFRLFSNHNDHEIYITVARVDTDKIISVKSGEKLKEHIAKRKNGYYSTNDGLYPAEDKRKHIIEIIKKQKSEEPINSRFLNLLIEILEK